MMSAPIPSFFKIRLVIIIIGFFFLCFFIGFLRNCFAYTNYTTGDVVTVKNAPDGFEQPVQLDNVYNNPTTSIYDPALHDSLLGVYYNGINLVSIRQLEIDAYYGTTLYKVYNYFYHHVDAPSPCPDAELSLAALCGGDGPTYYYINEETCAGHCTPTGECAEEYEQKLIECGGTDKLKNWYNTTCTGVCISCRDNALDWANKNCGSSSYFADYDNPTCDADNNYIPPTIGSPCLTCTDAQDRCINKCGNTSSIEVFKCNDITPTDGYQHIDTYTCSCLPPETTCNDYRLSCEQQCGGTDLIEFYSCTEGDLSSRICKCPDTPLENGSIKPTDPPDDPNADNPAAPPDPDSTDSQLLSSIENNTRSTVQNSKIITDQLAQTNQKLDWIGDNNKIIADNTAAIGDGLNNLTDAVNNLKNEDKSSDILQDISNGQFTPPSDLIPYSDGKEKYDFSARFSQFLTDMKDTPIFSLPNSISQDIPTSGSSVLTINAGQYGTHDFDFANWGNSLLILRTVCLIVFSWVAIRIILLKR